MNNKANPLIPHWLVVAAVFLTLVAYVAVCQVFGHELRQPLSENQRVIVRTVLYGLAILGFPVTNLIRHIQLRLNQTMPGSKPAASRYLLTVTISMMIMESIGFMGFLMFVLGDDFNTLYIFITLALLGLFLYRPKADEYEAIEAALAENAADG